MKTDKVSRCAKRRRRKRRADLSSHAERSEVVRRQDYIVDSAQEKVCQNETGESKGRERGKGRRGGGTQSSAHLSP